jgi:hypothetical protein
MLYGDNFSSSYEFNDLHMKVIYCYGTIRPNQKVMPSDFGRILRLKQCDIKTRVKDDLAAAVWKDKHKHSDKYALSSIRSDVCD